MGAAKIVMGDIQRDRCNVTGISIPPRARVCSERYW
jgi:predicted nucleic acid-binding Zn ribbon protein